MAFDFYFYIATPEDIEIMCLIESQTRARGLSRRMELDHRREEQISKFYQSARTFGSKPVDIALALLSWHEG